MNLLDMRTVFFSYVISSVISVAVMASLWSQNRRRSPGLAFWLADFSLQFTGLLLSLLRGNLPDFFSMVISNTLIIGGTLLLLIGLERYTGKTGPQWHNYLFLGAFILVQIYFTYFQPSLPARNINVSLGIIFLCAQCAWLLLRRVAPGLRPSTRWTGVVFSAFCLVGLVRIFVSLATPANNDFFKSGLYDTLVILTYQMLYISLTFALFLMVNRRLFTALESDIRERQRAEAALKISEEKFSVAFQNIPDALVITALADGKIIEANESFFRMAGFSKADSLGRTTVELNLWGNLAHRNQLVADLQKQRRVLNFETEFRKKSGELFPGWISGELIQLQGQTCVLNVIHDASERKRIEAALRETNDYLENLFNYANAPIIVWNPQFKITRFNHAFETITGRSAAEVLGKSLEILFPPAQVEASLEHIQKTVTGEHWKVVEINIQHVDGSIHTVLWNSATLFSADGKIPIATIAQGQDITVRKQAEAQLVERHATLNAILESSAVPVFSLDRDYRYTSFNSAHAAVMKALYGAEIETGQSMLAYQAVPEDRAEARKNLDRALRGEQIIESAYSGEPGHTRRYFDVTHNPICDTTGEVIGVSVFANDITERKQAAEKLIASEVRYRRLFEAAKDGILILDAETGKVVDVNPFLIEMLGFSYTEILGKELWELGIFKDIAANKANFLELQRKEYIRYEDLPLETAAGRRFHVEFVSNVYQVNHHKVVQCNIRDITERKQIEEKITQYANHLEEMVRERTRELRDAQAQLVRQERLATLGQLAGSIGHELRNPLGVIANAIYYLKLIQPEAQAEVKEYLGLVEQETRTADKIITDLLGFARTDATDRETISVSELLGQTLKRFPVPPAVAVALELPADLPPVYADPRQMMQVLGNLVMNACQAMPEGGKLTLSATLQAGLISIRVQDTGVGIPPENMQKLFEPLFTTKTTGIGLGLAVSKKLVEANGGRIEVESAPGQGAAFTVYLPSYQKGEPQ